LTGLFLPLLGGRLTIGVLVCEVEARNAGLCVVLAVGVALVGIEGEGRGGAGDLVLDPAEVVDRSEAELGVFLNVGLTVPGPVELELCESPGRGLGDGRAETSTFARTRGRLDGVEGDDLEVVAGDEMLICPVT
jgi:hypothetical protein